MTEAPTNLSSIYSCTNGHAVITYYEEPCPLCAMRRHVKAAEELLAPIFAKEHWGDAEQDFEHALLRLEAAVNLAGQRTPNLPRTAAS